MAGNPLRWGLIGASDIAETRMLDAMRRVGDKVPAVYSRSAERASEFAARNDIDTAFTDLDQLLSRIDIDAVYISSKNEHHLAQAAAAAAAGKHILCEKPLTTDLRDARAMIAAARDAAVVLAVNHHLPAAGTHRKIRELVHAGAIGKPLAVNVRHATLLPDRLRGWRLSGEPGAGAIMDLTCHDASVVNPMLGVPAIEAVAIGVRQGPWNALSDDAVVSVVRYTGDVLVHMHDSFTSPFTMTYVQVHGDEGSIDANNVMTPEPVGDVFLTNARGRRQIEVVDRRHTYDVTLLAFRGAAAGEQPPVVAGEDAFAALAISVAVTEASSTGKSRLVEHLTTEPSQSRLT
jgi:1,5-anhydro-D-fructose reductase (1,5-anhydro-D-mannitol-forming)